MSAVEVAVRAVAYAAAMFLFGSSMFLIYVPRDALRDAQDTGLREWRAVRRHVLRLQIGCVVATIVSGVLWFAIHAAVISGLPVAQAVMSSAAGAVLHGTLFGRMTALRLGMALAVAAMLVPGQRVDGVRALAPGDIARAALSGGVLATMAWMGHAAATPGVDGYIHLGADVAHLLAAGAWLGALPPLALMLVRAARARTPAVAVIAARTTQQFSRVGLVCVGVLLLTGGVNAWYLVGTPAALFGTRYGQLLLLKLALFALMLVLAAGNRLRLMPYVAAAAGGTAEHARPRRCGASPATPGSKSHWGSRSLSSSVRSGSRFPERTPRLSGRSRSRSTSSCATRDSTLVAGELLLVSVAGAAAAVRAAAAAGERWFSRAPP